MQIRPYVPALLRTDTALNLGGAFVLAAFGAPLADALGLAAAWPLYVVAVLMLANAAQLWATSRDPRPGMLTALAAVDFVFAAVVVAFAFTGDAMATWARPALFAVAVATVLVGEAKLLGRQAPATA